MATCNRCDGEGVVVTCIDDICRGAGECFHGDGEVACGDCLGTGFYDAEWDGIDEDETP